MCKVHSHRTCSNCGRHGHNIITCTAPYNKEAAKKSYYDPEKQKVYNAKYREKQRALKQLNKTLDTGASVVVSNKQAEQQAKIIWTMLRDECLSTAKYEKLLNVKRNAVSGEEEKSAVAETLEKVAEKMTKILECT